LGVAWVIHQTEVLQHPPLVDRQPGFYDLAAEQAVDTDTAYDYLFARRRNADQIAGMRSAAVQRVATLSHSAI
jgi:hypothetical protein